MFFVHLSFTGQGKDAYKIKTIVIDAGHGGHDAGCLGASSREKHVALDIALKLGKMIETNYPDIRVIYTRKSDVFIPLHERANIANRAHADLFICIHLNAGGKAAYGSETYVMGNHKTESNLDVAKRENATILLEDDYLKKYDGFDPNSPEANIIFSLYQSQFMSQSLLFASNIQDEFTEYAGRNNRGVKQAGFLVLYKTAMPAVLIECGFLTHEPEEKFLVSDKGQNTMAAAIYRAFKEYKVDMETTSGNSAADPSPKSDPVKMEKDPVPVPPVEEVKVLKPDSSEEKVVVNPTPHLPQPPTTTPTPTPTPSKQNTGLKDKILNDIKSPAVFISVQIGASKNPASDNSKFTTIESINMVECADGFTRYCIGKYLTIADARKKLNQVKANGRADAFLTAFNGNQRITIQEAEKLINKK
ncbi:MAG: N-acetylmuramoyl-L-alanine amidase [Bacteroidia bacterium]|jgi:N-acetylmuramoyl-L-alanine amidase|nr:N-acetylmuramoyl-L-alanine amidase [Bacteroidia bacterium]MBP7243674.1 N-acetylmuramoyl-L-alanine amidase [Bacteroidia bacterium]